MRFHRIILCFLLVLLCPVVRAQSLSVESFRLLENDLTANTYGTMERDQNGEVAALIRVVTLETGFAFDAGMLGVVKTTQKTGEIWVYVPYGLQRITIFHQEFGVVRDYYFPVPIERARTYEMVLKAERKPDPNQQTEAPQYINVNVENPMDKAELYLNGLLMGRGSMQLRVMTLTDYRVEIKQEGYHTYSTSFNFKPSDDDSTVSLPRLRPIKGILDISSEPSGAQVFIGGVYSGTTPLVTDSLQTGIKIIGVKKNGYRDYNTTVTITDEKKYQVKAILKEIKHLHREKMFYLGGGYEIGHHSAVAGFAGLYISKFNLEAEFRSIQPAAEKTIWVTSPQSWSGSSNAMTYDFSTHYSFGGSVGKGFSSGNRLRITPQIGVVYYGLEGTYLQTSQDEVIADEDRTAKTYVFSAKASARTELSLFNGMSLVVSPGYEIPVFMGSLAKQINDNSDKLKKKWCGGLSVRAGIEIYF